MRSDRQNNPSIPPPRGVAGRGGIQTVDARILLPLFLLEEEQRGGVVIVVVVVVVAAVGPLFISVRDDCSAIGWMNGCAFFFFFRLENPSSVGDGCAVFEDDER